jgi:hypothetical protein
VTKPHRYDTHTPSSPWQACGKGGSRGGRAPAPPDIRDERQTAGLVGRARAQGMRQGIGIPHMPLLTFAISSGCLAASAECALRCSYRREASKTASRHRTRARTSLRVPLTSRGPSAAPAAQGMCGKLSLPLLFDSGDDFFLLGICVNGGILRLSVSQLRHSHACLIWSDCSACVVPPVWASISHAFSCLVQEPVHQQ